MDGKPPNQNFLDGELVDIETLKNSWIIQHLEDEIMEDEFEKVDKLAFNQLCQSFENEILESNKMHILTLIQSLEDEGMVNSQFRSVYLLMKKEKPPSFFRNSVFIFFRDALSVIKNLILTLKSSSSSSSSASSSSVVDFDLLNMHCLQLKGSSSCIGACTIMNECSNFIEAIDKKSKNECLQAVKNLNKAYRELHIKFRSFMKVL
uniref:Histidine-containing phosphotransfer protein n=1 Tax=Solanum lycopersicum TaxID=4081 RepID=K4D4Y5_SOLLC